MRVDTKRDYSAGLGAGKVIGLCNSDKWHYPFRSEGHAVVSIGNDTYLSLDAPTGILFSTLDHLKKTMDMNVSFVFFDAEQGIDLLSIQGHIDPASISHTAEKLYEEIARHSSVTIPIADITSEILKTHFDLKRQNPISPSHPFTYVEMQNAFSENITQPKPTGNIFTNFFGWARDYVNSVVDDVRSLQPNLASAQAAYQSARFAEIIADHMRTSGSTFNPRTFQTSQNPGLVQLAHYLSSPKDFTNNANRISQEVLKFIHGDSKDAAEHIEQTTYRLQMEFLDNIKHYSENNPNTMFDHVTALMNKENIPQDLRSFYYQQVLSALPLNEDFSVDHIKSRERHDEIKLKFGGLSKQINDLQEQAQTYQKQNTAEAKKNYNDLSKQISDLQKNADAHHKQFQTSLKKITNAINKNTDEIHDLKVGQKEIIDFLKEQQIESAKQAKELEKEKRDKAEIEGYKKGAQFVSMFGDVADSPFFKDAGTACMAGALAYEASIAMSGLAANASFGACLGPLAMAGMAALMVISMLVTKDNEPHEDPFQKQVLQMLQQIMSKLDVMHKEMHQRFDQLLEQGYENRRIIIKGFDSVLAEIKILANHHLQNHYAAEKLAAKVDSVTSKIDAGFAAVQSTLVQPSTIQQILKPPRKDYLKSLELNRVDSLKQSLMHFLTETSCSRSANASDVIVRHNGKVNADDAVAIAEALYDQANVTDVSKIRLHNLLGLLGGLANHHSGSDACVPQPESLLNPNQWRQAIVAYEKLLTECNPALGADKELYIEGIHERSDRAEKLHNFLHNLRYTRYNSDCKKLYEKLSDNYHDSLNDIIKLIQEHLRAQEDKFYTDSCIPVSPLDRLIQLDETFNEASERQVNSYFQECNERAPVHFRGITGAHDHTVGASNSDMLLSEDLNVQERFFRMCQGGACNNQGHCTCNLYNASQAAWTELKRHYSETVKPAINGMLLAETEKQLSLGLRLLQIVIERNLDINIKNVSMIGADIDHQFQNAIKLEGEDSLIFISGVSRYHDGNGDHHPHETQYRRLYMTAHLYRSNCYGGGEWAITTADKKSLEAFLKRTAARVHQLLKSYRDQAITELLSDVRFKKALDKLESNALQIHAFMNLLGVDPTTYQNKVIRAEHIKDRLTDIQSANANDAIDEIKFLLSKLGEKELTGDKIFSLVQAVNIYLNPLYKWAEETVDDLGKLELKVRAWTDAPAPKTESADTTLLREEIKELRKEIASRRVIELETDSSDDEDGFERETRTKSESMGHVHVGRFWKKRPGDEAGVRVLDESVPKHIRTALFTTPPQSRKLEKEKLTNGEKTLLTQLATVRVRQ